MTVPTLRTERLVLRAWTGADRVPFAALNSDPEVVRWIGAGVPLSRSDSDELMARIQDHWRTRGFGLWALEELTGGAFVGFAGLAVPWFLPAVLPAVEVGWRLARGAWGRGYATEAATAALEHAFAKLELREVIATIFPDNTRSVRVAEKLGMRFSERRIHPSVQREIEIYRTLSPPGGARHLGREAPGGP